MDSLVIMEGVVNCSYFSYSFGGTAHASHWDLTI